jgi:hypothetical protein
VKPADETEKRDKNRRMRLRAVYVPSGLRPFKWWRLSIFLILGSRERAANLLLK